MSSEMVERVARALFLADYPEAGEVEEIFWERKEDGYKLAARAAIEAMMEPTEEMFDAACEVGPDTNAGQFGYDDATMVYQAMIKEALK